MSLHKNGYLTLNLDLDIVCNKDVLKIFNEESIIKKIEFDKQYSYITNEINKLNFQFDIKKVILRDKLFPDQRVNKSHHEKFELYVFKKKYLIDLYGKMINGNNESSLIYINEHFNTGNVNSVLLGKYVTVNCNIDFWKNNDEDKWIEDNEYVIYDILAEYKTIDVKIGDIDIFKLALYDLSKVPDCVISKALDERYAKSDLKFDNDPIIFKKFIMSYIKGIHMEPIDFSSDVDSLGKLKGVRKRCVTIENEFNYFGFDLNTDHNKIFLINMKKHYYGICERINDIEKKILSIEEQMCSSGNVFIHICIAIKKCDREIIIKKIIPKYGEHNIKVLDNHSHIKMLVLDYDSDRSDNDTNDDTDTDDGCPIIINQMAKNKNRPKNSADEEEDERVIEVYEELNKGLDLQISFEIFKKIIGFIVSGLKKRFIVNFLEELVKKFITVISSKKMLLLINLLVEKGYFFYRITEENVPNENKEWLVIKNTSKKIVDLLEKIELL